MMKKIKKPCKIYGFLLVIGLHITQIALAMPTMCRPILWPTTSAVMHPERHTIPVSSVELLEKWSKHLIHKSPHPIAELHSAGKIMYDDPELVATRLALQDAEHVAVLALTYRLTKNKAYYDKAKQILLNWARVNHPTGHPIDETKLEGMIWAYDLIACDLSVQDKQLILHWFDTIRRQKNAWAFTPMTSINNHRIHQIKMLLLLDKILQRPKDWLNETTRAAKYAQINLDPNTGISIDYTQRNALYYHNYDMQPWLEISLLSDCCHPSIDQGFAFLQRQIIMRNIDHEFLHSQVKLDQRRAQHGFIYSRRDGRFDVRRAAPTIVAYYTLHARKPDPKLWQIVEDTDLSSWLIFIKTRRILWQSTQS